MKTVFLLEKIQYQMEITRYWYIDIWLLALVLTLNADNQKSLFKRCWVNWFKIDFCCFHKSIIDRKYVLYSNSNFIFLQTFNLDNLILEAFSNLVIISHFQSCKTNFYYFEKMQFNILQRKVNCMFIQIVKCISKHRSGTTACKEKL